MNVKRISFCFLAAIFLFGWVAAGAATAKTYTCVVCGKPITGSSYVLADGQYYHPQHFTCANCGKRIRTAGYFAHDHKIYDTACYMDLFAPRCAYCGKPMLRDFIEVGGKQYHQYCYNTKVALRCAICGRVIEGPYLVDYYGNRVHKSHKGKIAQCEYCGRFISPSTSKGSVIYADGRQVCGYCAQTVVDGYPEALALLQTVRDTLAQEGINVDLSRLTLFPVDKIKMAELKPPRGDQAQAFTFFVQSKRLYGLLSTQDYKIYVLDRLPRMEFITTIAHELMHVWLGQNAEFQMNPQLAEGSCNYAAFLALRHFGPDAQYAIDKMAKDEDPTYGDGFRHVALFAEFVTTNGWLDYLKKNSTPPW